MRQMRFTLSENITFVSAYLSAAPFNGMEFQALKLSQQNCIHRICATQFLACKTLNIGICNFFQSFLFGVLSIPNVTITTNLTIPIFEYYAKEKMKRVFHCFVTVM